VRRVTYSPDMARCYCFAAVLLRVQLVVVLPVLGLRLVSFHLLTVVEFLCHARLPRVRKPLLLLCRCGLLAALGTLGV
jgi:hypothetical protein